MLVNKFFDNECFNMKILLFFVMFYKFYFIFEELNINGNDEYY